MSFTTEVKSEIAQNELKTCCQKAELSALVQLCSSLTINAQGMSLMIKTETRRRRADSEAAERKLRRGNRLIGHQEDDLKKTTFTGCRC
ncbi:MAG: hypothetical protein ACLSA6_05755 [Holdemania massiliensis]